MNPYQIYQVIELIFWAALLPITFASPFSFIIYLIQNHMILMHEKTGTFKKDKYLRRVESATFFLFAFMVVYIISKFKAGYINEEELPALLLFLCFSIHTGFYYTINTELRVITRIAFSINFWLAAVCFWIWFYAGFNWGPMFG
ncbi:MAG: hypothetical protein ABI723_00715 [Bacteroidia bacterium]